MLVADHHGHLVDEHVTDESAAKCREHAQEHCRGAGHVVHHGFGCAVDGVKTQCQRVQ